MEMACHASYPLNSENASPPGTFTAYLSCAEMAKPPKTASQATIPIVSMFLRFTSAPPASSVATSVFRKSWRMLLVVRSPVGLDKMVAAESIGRWYRSRLVRCGWSGGRINVGGGSVAHVTGETVMPAEHRILVTPRKLRRPAPGRVCRYVERFRDSAVASRRLDRG